MIHLTPEQEAHRLVHQFLSEGLLDKYMGITSAKMCAKINVQNIVQSRSEDDRFNDSMAVGGSEYYTPHPLYKTYWDLVLQAIEKI